MDAFFQFLSANLVTMYILLVVLVVVIIALLLLVLDAYRKGQPLFLWLLKIEAKSDKKDSAANEKAIPDATKANKA